MNHPACIIHPLRLLPGQDLKLSIEEFVTAKQIRAGFIISGIGSLKEYHLRFANQSHGIKASGHFEVISLSGTLSADGCHLHVSLGDEYGQVCGGHLLPGNIVYTTIELIIGESPNFLFTRRKDGTTDWPELNITPIPKS